MILYPVEPLDYCINQKTNQYTPPTGPWKHGPVVICLRKAGTLWLGRHYKIYVFPAFLSMIILCGIIKKDPSTGPETY